MNTYKKIVRVIRYFIDSRGYAKKVLSVRKNGSFITTYFDIVLCFLRYGFDFENYCSFELWNKTNSERQTFISCRRNAVLAKLTSTPEAYHLFLDKSEFNHRFAKFIHRDYMTVKGHSSDEIKQFVKKHSKVIAKPLNDYGGHGVIMLNENNIDSWTDEIGITKLENYIIEQKIENVANLKRLAPASLNTIRIVTCTDNNGAIHIMAALLRMGDGEKVTDNFFSGGMACPIDIEKYVLKDIAFGLNSNKYRKHPYSNIEFEGYSIPEVKQCLDLLRELSTIVPTARYIGWDFAVTPGGVELLEGNIPPGENITQLAAGRGLWNDICKWL